MPRPAPNTILDKRLIVLLLILPLPPSTLLSICCHFQHESRSPDGETDEVDEAETGLGVAWDRVDQVDGETSECDPCRLSKPE